MFEFEMMGGVEDLKQMEIELCQYLKLPELEIETYDDWSNKFNVKELDHEHEKQIDTGMITDFPEWTSPFWNMARNDDGTSKKIDVILGGMETIGSAERSTDKEQMRDTFYTISDGGYAQLIIDKFGKERVEKELDHDHEETIGTGMITDFPEWTSPFWNMSRNDDGTSRKIDVILGGMETIGSAERSTDKDQMRDTFYTISDGGYAQLIIDKFGKGRVEQELEQFLDFNFFPRSGGGIGMTRIISAHK